MTSIRPLEQPSSEAGVRGWSAAAALRVVLASVVGGVFILAAVGKGLDPVRFGLVAAGLVPEWIRTPSTIRFIVIGIVALEAALGAWLIFSGGSRRSSIAGLVVLLALTLGLGLLFAQPSVKECGCFGPMFEVGFGAALVRNLALMMMCLWIISEKVKGQPLPRRSGGAGFTLIELLVVIAVTAVIFSLAARHMLGARREARAIIKLSDLRQVAAATMMYGQDSRDMFPFLGVPGDPRARVVHEGVALPKAFFRSNAIFWANLIWPDYISSRAMLERRVLGERDTNHNFDVGGTFAGLPDDILITEVMLTHAALADPIYWRDVDHVPVDLSFERIRGQRIDSIRHPSRKGLLIVGEGLYFKDDAGAARFALGDGSAQRVNFDAVLKPEFVVGRPWGAISVNMMSTLDGFEGVDF